MDCTSKSFRVGVRLLHGSALTLLGRLYIFLSCVRDLSIITVAAVVTQIIVSHSKLNTCYRYKSDVLISFYLPYRPAGVHGGAASDAGGG